MKMINGTLSHSLYYTMKHPQFFNPFLLHSSVSVCCPDEFNSITTWLHRSHYRETSRDRYKQMKMTPLQPVHTRMQPWERLHRGRVRNKNLSLDYFKQNKSQASDTHFNLRARQIVTQTPTVRTSEHAAVCIVTVLLVKERNGHTCAFEHTLE